MEIKTPFAANGFLYNPKKQEILLHLRDGNTKFNPNKWSFFGGAAEEGETPEQCAAREMKEELCIDVPVDKLIYLRDYVAKDYPETTKSKYQHSFYIESDMPKSKMKLTEGADFDWVPLNKIFDLDLGDEIRKSLKLFVEKIKN